ncbi:hypothetical protein BAUCODRAFT_30395, partial [Baudoinia panamericana UAMH 10762]
MGGAKGYTDLKSLDRHHLRTQDYLRLWRQRVRRSAAAALPKVCDGFSCPGRRQASCEVAQIGRRGNGDCGPGVCTSASRSRSASSSLDPLAVQKCLGGAPVLPSRTAMARRAMVARSSFAVRAAARRLVSDPMRPRQQSDGILYHSAPCATPIFPPRCTSASSFV